MSDYLIIGAGIVGLATAYQLKQSEPNARITLLEKESGPAYHQTGNNSGVVHSGIYYKPGSHKARHCMEGRLELLQFCDRHGIAYRKMHKLIVATEKEELPRLHEIYARGLANGVADSALLCREKVLEIEPHIQAVEAIHIPSCYVINYRNVAQKLVQLLQSLGCEILFHEKVIGIKNDSVITENRSYFAKKIINCAGLFSDRIARLNSLQKEQQILPFRGEYYELTEKRCTLVNGLIYPVPDPQFPFLGVHLTRMIDDRVEAGPNAVLAYAREGYKKSDLNFKDLTEMLTYPGFWSMARRYWDVGLQELYRSWSKKAFVRTLQKLMPTLQGEDLIRGGSGIRAQLVTRQGRMVDDFSFVREGNCLHVLNAPSPAATASFSIGRYIAETIKN